MVPLYERDTREMIDSTRSFYAALRKRDVDELEYSKFFSFLLFPK
jgi:hypothetical protein